jgi:hypothetical protein
MSWLELNWALLYTNWASCQLAQIPVCCKSPVVDTVGHPAAGDGEGYLSRDLGGWKVPPHRAKTGKV